MTVQRPFIDMTADDALGAYFAACRQEPDAFTRAQLTSFAFPLHRFGSAAHGLFLAEINDLRVALQAAAVVDDASDLEAWLAEHFRAERFAALALLSAPSAMRLLERERERALADRIKLIASRDVKDRLQDAFWAAPLLATLVPQHAPRVREILLEVLETRACAQSMVGAAYGLLDMDARDVAPQLVARMRAIRENSETYEADLASGHFAVILALFDHGAALPEIQASYANAEAYHDSAVSFVSRFRYATWYATWYLSADAQAAKAWIEDSANKTSLAHAAAALADLHAVDALPTLTEARRSIRNPATRVAVDEAIRRLTTQTGAPDAAHRLVRLFGRRHESELALGWDSDDAFATIAERVAPVGAADDCGVDDR